MDSDSKDELVDGASIAAQIIHCLPSKEQARLVMAINSISPETARKIQINILTLKQQGHTQRSYLDREVEVITDTQATSITLEADRPTSLEQDRLNSVNGVELKAARQKVVEALEDQVPKELPALRKSTKSRIA